MIATKTSRRLARWITLAVVTGSLAVGAQAADRPAASYYGPYGPQTIQSKALNCMHIRAQDCLTDAELRALTIRSQEMNRRYAADGGGAFIPGVTDFPARPAYVEPGWTPPTTIERVTVDGFQWADAGIGAGLASSALLLAVGALAVLRRRRLVETLGA